MAFFCVAVFCVSSGCKVGFLSFGRSEKGTGSTELTAPDLSPAVPTDILIEPPTNAVSGVDAQLAVNVCSREFKVVAYDAKKKLPANVRENTQVLFSIPVYTDPNCEIISNTILIPKGQSSAAFYMKEKKVYDPSQDSSTSYLRITANANAHGFSIASVKLLSVIRTITTIAFSTDAFTQVQPRNTVGQNVCKGLYLLPQDGNGALFLPSVFGVAVDLSDGSARKNFYADSQCSSPISNKEIHYEGSSRLIFYKNGNLNEQVTLKTSGPTLVFEGRHSLKITSMGYRLGFTFPNTSEFDSKCTKLTVSLLDFNGNPTTDALDRTLDIMASRGGQFYSDASCVGQNDFVIPTGSTSVNVYYRPMNVGLRDKEAVDFNASLRVSSSGPLLDPILSAYKKTLTYRGVGQIRIKNPPAAIVAGKCTSIQVGLETSQGTPATDVSAHQISLTIQSRLGPASSPILSSPIEAVNYYSDSSCQISSFSTMTIPADSTLGTFYVRTRTSNPTLIDRDALTIHASETSFNLTDNVSSEINGPYRVVFTYPTTPMEFKASQCNQLKIKIVRESGADLQNYDGVSRDIRVDATFMHSSGLTDAGEFYTSSSCTGPKVSSLVLSYPSGALQTEQTFYFKPSNGKLKDQNSIQFVAKQIASEGEVCSAETCRLKEATINQTFGGAGKLVIVSPLPSTILEAKNCTKVEIQTVRNTGEPLNDSIPRDIMLSASVVGGQAMVGGFYSDSACTISSNLFIHSGTQNLAAFFRHTSIQVVNGSRVLLTASNVSLESGSQAYTMHAPGVLNFRTPTPPAEFSTGICSKVVLELLDKQKDLGGVSIADSINRTIILASTAGGFYSDDGCTSAVPNSRITVVGNTNTDSATLYFRHTAETSVTLTATSAPLAGATLSVTVKNHLESFTLSHGEILPRASVCSGPIMIQAKDGIGLNFVEPFRLGFGFNTPEPIWIRTGSPEDTYFSDRECKTPLSSRDVIGGNTTFYFIAKTDLAQTSMPVSFTSKPSISSGSNPGPYYSPLRYDNSFSSNGKADYSSMSSVRGALDGTNLVIAGYTPYTNGYGIPVIRISPTGSYDTSFRSAGSYTFWVNLGESNSITVNAVLVNGSYYYVVYTLHRSNNDDEIRILRMNSNGFGEVFDSNAPDGSRSETAHAAAIVNEKLVVVGRADSDALFSVYNLSTLGRESIAFPDLGNSDDGFDSVTSDDASASAIIGGHSNSQLFITKYIANQLDTTFGSSGFRYFPGTVTNAVGIIVQSGTVTRYVVAGSNGADMLTFAATKSNGEIDTTFGTNGLISYDRPGIKARVLATYPFANESHPEFGKLLVLSTKNNTEFHLQRFKPSGVPDDSYGANVNERSYNFGNMSDASTVLTRSGKITAIGTTGGSAAGVLQYLP